MITEGGFNLPIQISAPGTKCKTITCWDPTGSQCKIYDKHNYLGECKVTTNYTITFCPSNATSEIDNNNHFNPQTN